MLPKEGIAFALFTNIQNGHIHGYAGLEEIIRDVIVPLGPVTAEGEREYSAWSCPR